MHALFTGLLDICTTYRHVSSAMIIRYIREGEFCPFGARSRLLNYWIDCRGV